jgi:hypothetical protein
MLNNQIPQLSPGSYRVTVEAAALKRAPTREPMIEYLFRLVDGGQRGERRRSLQIITPETYAGTVHNLKVCGVECEAKDIAGHLPQARGVELDIEITDEAALIFTRRLDSRSAAERGVSEAAEPLPDVAALFGAACGDGPRLELCSVEDWECGDSLLLELDPTFQIIEREQ